MTTSSPHPWPVPPSLQQRPIAALPTTQRVREPAPARALDALPDYLRNTRPWDRNLVHLPTSVSCALWVDLAGATAVGGWLAAVRAGVAPCGGTLCRIATLGHPGLLLVLAAGSVVALLGLAPFTAGLTRAGGPELAVMTVAAAAGIGALLGVVALAALGVMGLFLAVVALVAVVERG